MPKASRRKEIINIKAKLNDIGSRKIIEKKKSVRQAFDSLKRSVKLTICSRLTMKKKEKTLPVTEQHRGYHYRFCRHQKDSKEML